VGVHRPHAEVTTIEGLAADDILHARQLLRPPRCFVWRVSIRLLARRNGRRLRIVALASLSAPIGAALGLGRMFEAVALFCDEAPPLPAALVAISSYRMGPNSRSSVAQMKGPAILGRAAGPSLRNL
jgi:hypothetical protein